ncbi:ABC transporter, partial [Intestinimonas butyriciproducens]|nr:ABC transporter [Intestinimonas butyriciproducens]
MKNMKKLLCVALGAALSLSLLAACSGGSATTPAPETT